MTTKYIVDNLSSQTIQGNLNVSGLTATNLSYVNQGSKLLVKQQINLSEPLIPTGYKSLINCNSGVCPSEPPFLIGETVTNGSGATGIVVADVIASLLVENVVGTFNIGDTVTGLTSNNTRTLVEITDYQYSIQTITLTGGTKFIFDRAFITNCENNPTTVSSVVLTTGTTPYNVVSYNAITAFSISGLLPTENNYTENESGGGGVGPIPLKSLIDNTVYYQQFEVEPIQTTADLYIYGYIIN